jgi:signal transduction histidine kinase
LTGYDELGALAAAGGLSALFAVPGTAAETGAMAPGGKSQALSITTQSGGTLPADGRLFAVPWNGAPALALVLATGADIERRRAAELTLAAAEHQAGQVKQNAEQELAALRRDIATVRTAADRDLQAAQRERDNTGRRLEDTERELAQAKREAQRATAAKGEFLSRISHDIRTPLNAISGFAEVVMAERFGPIGNERYREYIKDIHGAATHLGSLLSDLLDLTKVESGELDLAFAKLGVNEVIAQCVGLMQPQANRARIIIRSSLAPGLPQVVADERSLRQIVLNLLANSIKLTGPGGQVIVSTALSDSGEVMVRVRDTGVGMSATDIEAALAPFRQSATTAGSGAGTAGLALPLTKALAEANGAHFAIKSAPNAGTIAEVVFPLGRIAPP